MHAQNGCLNTKPGRLPDTWLRKFVMGMAYNSI